MNKTINDNSVRRLMNRITEKARELLRNRDKYFFVVFLKNVKKTLNKILVDGYITSSSATFQRNFNGNEL